MERAKAVREAHDKGSSEARAASDRRAEERMAAANEAHAAALSQVKGELEAAEAELAEERRMRKAIEVAAKHGAHEAMAEQARWRASAAEGWLTAGREAKRRQETQLARMSDMIRSAVHTRPQSHTTATNPRRAPSHQAPRAASPPLLPSPQAARRADCER